jgi:cell division protein FtsZ
VKQENIVPEKSSNDVVIKVIGVGGGGNNAVNRMATEDARGVDFIAVNTDEPVLAVSCAAQKILIGEKSTRGRGAGADPEVGRNAAEENRNQISKALSGADLVFVAAGMGGGTGTGATPIVADIARETGALTVGVVTKPFQFEGEQHMEQAEEGIRNLLGKVDSLIVIPNERLKLVTEEKITFRNAFALVDDVLRQVVVSISELIGTVAVINLDFADVCAVMRNAGRAHIGVGRAAGKDKAEAAAHAAISSPLMESSIDGARGVLINITGSPDIELDEVTTAASLVRAAAHPGAKIIFGAAFDETMEDELCVTVIATRFDDPPAASKSAAFADIFNQTPPSSEDEDEDVFKKIENIFLSR